MTSHRGLRVSAIICLISIALIIPAGAQKNTGSGGTTGGTTGGNTGGTTTGGTTNTSRSTITNIPSTRTIDHVGPIFLTGKVMMDDGTPLPQAASIERVCGGATHREAHTDGRGFFSFQLGQNASVMQDASNTSTNDLYGMHAGTQPGLADPTSQPSFSASDLIGCELRAVLPGYRSSSVLLTEVRYNQQQDVGTIFLQSMEKVAGTTVSVVSMQAPKAAKKEFEKGHQDLTKGRMSEAREHLEKSLQHYPKYAAASLDLGLIEYSNHDIPKARARFHEAITSDPNFVQPYLQLALLSAQESDWPKVVELTQKAAQLDALDFPMTFYLNAVANYNLSRLNDAESSARRGIRLDGIHHLPRLQLILARILQRKNDAKGAAAQLRDYLKYAPEAKDADAVKAQLAQLEKDGSVAQQ